jgi:hypothetical protein
MQNWSKFLGAGFCAMTLCLTISGNGAAFAQTAGTKDLQVEVNPSTSAAGVAETSGPVQVSLMTVGPSVIEVGTPILLEAGSNRNGFGSLYIVGASGKVTMLAENVPVVGGKLVQFPESSLILRAAPPAGDDQVLFLVTRDRFDGFAGGKTTSTPVDVQVTGEGLNDELSGRLGDTPRDRWAFTTINVRVVD